jgi:hypothetical protein
MRKAVMSFVLSVGLIAVWAAPADAASTRAEYVAQVDPICQSFVGPENTALNTFRSNLNRLGRVARSSVKTNNFKPFIRQTRRTASSLTTYAQVHSNLTDQAVAVAPAPGDAASVNTWISQRRRAESVSVSAATALSQFRARSFFGLLKQADAAEVASANAISGMGFQVCGVSA